MKTIQRLFLDDKFILILIFLNAITIFGEGFELNSRPVETLIHILDSIFTIAFVVEMIIKLNTWGKTEYFKSNWNKMDFILVMMSLPSLLLLFFDESYAGLSFLLIFRVARVFKFFRFLKFIPGITDLGIGLQRALKTSVVVLFGFILYNFIISILSCYLFKEISPEDFGNPVSSFYSTFRVFTVEGWYEIPEKITAQTSHIQAFLIKGYFMIILITGGIFGLSIVNSIFVDAMVSDNNDDLERKVDELTKKIDFLIQNQKNNEK